MRGRRLSRQCRRLTHHEVFLFQHHFLMRFPYHAFSSPKTEEPKQCGVDEEVE